MSFELEKDMSQIVVDVLPKRLEIADQFAFGFEVPLGYRQIDLGLMELPSVLPETSRTTWFRQMQVRDLWDLAVLIHSGESAVEQVFDTQELIILSKSGKSVQEIGSVKQLVQQLIEFSRGDVHPLIFVELKLRDWRKALVQAKYCLRAGSIACVVVDGATLPTVSVDRFEVEGVGLFGAWENNVELVVPPKITKAKSGIQGVFHRLRVLHDLSSNGHKKWQLGNI
jgi:hypothetical protein